MKINLKDVIRPTAVLFLICLITTALLAGTNKITAPIIERISEENAAEVRQQVLPQAASFTEIQGSGAYTGYTADQTLCGYVFTQEEKGYGGAIKVMVGIGVDGMVTGVSVLEHNETPGLGANVTRADFLAQYKEPTAGSYAVTKDGGSVDAVTGATISSRAVTRAVNRAYEEYHAILNGEVA